MEKYPQFETEHLLIRVLRPIDAEHVYYYRSLPEVCEFQGWRPKNIAEVVEFLRENAKQPVNTPHTWLQFAVCLKDGQIIGDVGIHFPDSQVQAEVAYTLSPAYQGKGYALEAVKALVDYLFGTLKKHRVYASVDPRNVPSYKLLEKLGFRKEAHFVKSYWMAGEWCDDVIYAILDDEWLLKMDR